MNCDALICNLSTVYVLYRSPVHDQVMYVLYCEYQNVNLLILHLLQPKPCNPSSSAY